MFFLANIVQPLIDINEAILRFWHDTVGFSWGASIIGLTIVVRLAILPLTFKQVRSMQALQQLQPEIKKLQERYKDDKQRMQQEMMDFYKENQVNPLGSCLPLVLQLPFFMGLFYTLRSHEFRTEVLESGQKSFVFIHDITQPATGAVLVALILIYIGTQLGSSHVSAMVAQDKNQKRLLYALPFIFVPFVVQFPAGLLVYWITTNTWTIGQQLTIRKLLPPPHLQEAKDAKDGKAKDGGGKTAAAQPAGKKKPGKLAAAVASARADAGSGKGGGNSSSGAASSTRADGRGSSGDGQTASKPKRSSGSNKQQQRSSGGNKQQQPKGGGGGGEAKAKSSSTANAGGNGRSGPPPGSPRRKKKRTGRRR